jgi:hypothetical protein
MAIRADSILNGLFASSEQLFGASSLSEGPHTVKLTNSDEGGWFDIDYAIVYV